MQTVDINHGFFILDGYSFHFAHIWSKSGIPSFSKHLVTSKESSKPKSLNEFGFESGSGLTIKVSSQSKIVFLQYLLPKVMIFIDFYVERKK